MKYYHKTINNYSIEFYIISNIFMAKFDVNNVSVETLLSYVKDWTIAIPEIQRPFVWDSTKVRDLIDSLYREYPVWYIITWKSPDVKLKDWTASEWKQILIDGQQRITALTASLLWQEVLDSDYKRKKIKIAFNLKTEEFQTSNPAIEKQEEWIHDIAEVMKSTFSAVKFSLDYASKFGLDVEEVEKRINKLRSIKDVMIWRIELWSMLDIETVTEIFVRINSKWETLSQADFAMSKISVNEKYEWNDIRKAIDYFCHFAKTPIDYENIKNNDTSFSQKEIFNKISWVKDTNEDLYLPSYVDVLRVAFTYKFKRWKLQDLVSLLSWRDFETREYKEEIIEDSFIKLYEWVRSFVNETNFKRYVMILKSAWIIDDTLVRSQNVLNFGYVLFLLLRERDINPDIIEKYVRRWVIMSIITQRYTSSPESQFDLDIRRLNEAENIIQYIDEELWRQLPDTFREGILAERFNTSVASSPYWKTYLIAQIFLNDNAFLSKDMKIKTLVEWRWDVHHIFPKDYLQKHGKDNKSVYNQIANFALIQTEINLQITNKSPDVYMGEVKVQCKNKQATIWSIVDEAELKDNFRINCIPENFINMTVNDFDEFLKERRILMAQKLKKYYNSL